VLEERRERFYWQNFPKTTMIKSRIEIVGFTCGLLIGLRAHDYNHGDDLELLTNIWLDAAGKSLFNFGNRPGSFFEKHECVITKHQELITIEKRIRGTLFFKLLFVEINGKKYLVVNNNDQTFHKFERVENPLTDDDFNEALLR